MSNVIAFKPAGRPASPKPTQKQDRRARQLDDYAQIKDLPEEVLADALLYLWPDKLPKVVRKLLSNATLQEWRTLRADERVADEAAYVRNLYESMGHPMDLPEFLDLLPPHRVQEAREACGERAALLQKTFAACPAIKCLTLIWIDNVFTLDFPTFDVASDPSLRDYLSLMLSVGGSAILRESTSLRVQVPLGDDTHQWLTQDRIYGFSCGEGGWEPQSAASLRSAYTTDAQTGARLPTDPTTTMGDARELMRRAKVRLDHGQ